MEMEAMATTIIWVKEIRLTRIIDDQLHYEKEIPLLLCERSYKFEHNLLK